MAEPGGGRWGGRPSSASLPVPRPVCLHRLWSPVHSPTVLAANAEHLLCVRRCSGPQGHGKAQTESAPPTAYGRLREETGQAAESSGPGSDQHTQGNEAAEATENRRREAAGPVLWKVASEPRRSDLSEAGGHLEQRAPERRAAGREGRTRTLGHLGTQAAGRRREMTSLAQGSSQHCR